MAQWLTNPIRNHEIEDLVPGLAQWVKRSGTAMSCGVGCRFGSDLVLLWLWCRQEANKKKLKWYILCYAYFIPI